MALHQFNIFWQIAFWPTRRERMTRGIPSLLLRTVHLVQWTLKYGETWETSLRNLMTTNTALWHSKHCGLWCPVSLSVSVSPSVTQMFLIEIWDIDLNLPTPGQLHQSIIEQSVSFSVINKVKLMTSDSEYLWWYSDICLELCNWN